MPHATVSVTTTLTITRDDGASSSLSWTRAAATADPLPVSTRHLIDSVTDSVLEGVIYLENEMTA